MNKIEFLNRVKILFWRPSQILYFILVVMNFISLQKLWQVKQDQGLLSRTVGAIEIQQISLAAEYKSQGRVLGDSLNIGIADMKKNLNIILEKCNEIRELSGFLQNQLDELKKYRAHTEGVFLPFKIQSLDIWNGAPYLHVRMKDNDLLSHDLTLFDSLAGWKVIEIDLERLRVSFENHEHLVQKVHLNRMNSSEMRG